jgi:hypothetical protein
MRTSKNLSILLAVMFILFVNNLIAQKDISKGSLLLKGKVIDSTGVGLSTEIIIKLANDTFFLNSDSLGFFEEVLKTGFNYQILYSKQGYKSKMIIVDTRNGGTNEMGYEIPIEITLEKGKKGLEQLKPIGIIFYDKETDLYESRNTYKRTPARRSVSLRRSKRGILPQ